MPLKVLFSKKNIQIKRPGFTSKHNKSILNADTDQTYPVEDTGSQRTNQVYIQLNGTHC